MTPRRRPHRNRKGSGSIYQQKGLGRSKNYMMQFTDANGERVCISSKTPDRAAALQRLNQHLAAVAEGKPVDQTSIGKHAPKFADGVALWEKDQTKASRKGLKTGLQMIERHLTPVFGTLRLDAITTTMVDDYYVATLKAGYEQATVNRHLGILRRMFNLAIEAHTFKGTMPTFNLPDPQNAREGFFEREQYDAVQAQLATADARWLQLPFTFTYITGWRFAAEVATLEWRHINWRTGIIRLDPHTTKNGKGRTFPFRSHPALLAVLEEARRSHDALAATGTIVARVFHRNGEALVYPPSSGRGSGVLKAWLWDAWRTACTAAGVDGRILHDLRRTAVRNLIDAGVPIKTAMELTGHRTLSVFLRYHIIDQSQLSDGVAKYATAGGAL